ncbi:MAG TPA: hypothetical protein DEG47_27415, partial [Cyanobacteria bacterium UBA11148]|nr:hypothetical protein [Cyanobacteria bacterium UBA11148]
MKVEKHPQRSKNPAITLLGVQPLGTLAFFLWVSSFPTQAVPSKEATTPRTFTDWCLNKAKESGEIQHTIDVLLREAETQECHQADKILSTRTYLNLESNQIANIKPLSSL